MQRVIRFWKSPSAFVAPTGTFRPNGDGRRYLSVAQMPYRSEALAEFGFIDTQPEPMFLNFVGEHFLDGAHTHHHQDVAPDGFVHVRANWMLEKPAQGGDPILGNEVVSIQPGDLWVCFASEEEHASTPIYGGIRRICSFGALIPRPPNFNLMELIK